jgi:hypothetical protein
MESITGLMVAGVTAGVVTAYSDFSLAAPTAIQSYLFSTSELSPVLMLMAGVALILFAGFREHQKLIDRKGLEGEE